MKPSPLPCATRSTNDWGTREVRPSHRPRAGVPGVLTALLERHGALVHRAGRAAEHEHAVSGQQRHGGVAHLLHGAPRAAGVVDRALVLVDQRRAAAAEGRALVEDGRHLGEIGPHRAEQRVVVHGPHDVVREPCAVRGGAGSRAAPASRPRPLGRRGRCAAPGRGAARPRSGATGCTATCRRPG